MSVFTLCVSCCDVRYNFRMKTIFGSSLPLVVCRRTHVLFTLFRQAMYILFNNLIYYILSSNKSIFCMTNMTGSKLSIFSQPGKITGYWITTRSFPYRGPYWPGPIWASTSLCHSYILRIIN
jgi:hypothetical protein